MQNLWFMTCHWPLTVRKYDPGASRTEVLYSSLILDYKRLFLLKQGSSVIFNSTWLILACL